MSDEGPQHGILQWEPEEGVPARRLLLVRHGHYDRVDDLGDETWGLSSLGWRQAARTGHRLARLIPHFGDELEGVYSSPWPRALQTAEATAHELELDRVRVKRYLHECIPLVPVAEDGVTSSHPTLPLTDGQDREQVTEQVSRVVARFFKPVRKPTTTLIFTHGNMIRYLLAHTLGLPYEAWMQIAICHASLTEIRVYPGEFVALIAYNETGHLSPEMISS